jgi:hypothetical protein
MKKVHNIARDDDDILIDHFDEVLNDCYFPIITVYYDTKDYPGKYVARLFSINSETGKPFFYRYIAMADSLDDIRATIPVHMYLSPRQENDDANIIESWL